MKLTYQQATISFCTDLTSPEGPSIPVASLLIGESEVDRVAGLAWLIPSNLDPLTRAMLNDLDRLVRKYVDEAFKRRSAAMPLSEVLSRVYHSLRNSLHVSTIHDPVDVEVRDPNELSTTVVGLVSDGIRTALANSGIAVVPKSRPSEGWSVPDSRLWTPPAPSPLASVAL
jgi:hypothetical protein